MLTVLIPTLDEAHWIGHSVRTVGASLREAEIPGEIVVCDGGSTDATRQRARQAGADRVIQTEQAGRAVQWNAGAASATGEILVLLHADTLVKPGWARTIHQAVEAGAVGGWCQVEIVVERGSVVCANGLGAVARGINLRTRLFRTATSDQSIFVRREVFETVGGVPTTPVMEGYELASRLREAGRVEVLGPQVRISGRRWEREGLVRTTLLGLVVRTAYAWGADPEWLCDLWEGRGARNDRGGAGV